jgi:superfamily II DNA helicase RecQ
LKRPWRDIFFKLAAKGFIRLLAVDEFHLVREQGQSFRPEFKVMGMVIATISMQESPYTRLIALTATSKLLDIAIVE